MNRRLLVTGAVAVAAIAVAGIYFSFIYANPAIIIRLVTSNPPVEGGLILPQNEKRNWDPARIEVEVGTPVTIAIVNNDDIEYHQFTIPELGVETEPIPPFESAIVEFTPTRAGTFKWIDPRPTETYTYTDYRGVLVKQVVDHSPETGEIVVVP